MALFDGPWARVDRARERRDEASFLWAQYLEREPFEVIVQVEDNGVGSIRIEMSEQPPATLAIVLGEYFYNLRSALDGAVYDAAIADTGQDPPPDADRLQFPVALTRAAFGRARAQIDALSIENKRSIESCQPYRSAEPRGTALHWVNEMARKDRHRRLHVLGAWVVEAKIAVEAPPGAMVVFEHLDPRGFVRESATVARFKVTPYSAGDRVHANPNAALDFEVEEFLSRPHDISWLRSPMAHRLMIIEMSTIAPTIALLEFVSEGRSRTAVPVTTREILNDAAHYSDFWPPTAGVVQRGRS
jgi:hypothetical protein